MHLHVTMPALDKGALVVLGDSTSDIGTGYL